MSLFDEDDDDFQTPLTRQTPTLTLSHKLLKPPHPTPTQRPAKIPRRSATAGKENAPPQFLPATGGTADAVECSLDSIPLSFDCCSPKDELLDKNRSYSRNSIESRLLKSRGDRSFWAGGDRLSGEDEGELDELLKLCSGLEGGGGGLSDVDGCRRSEGDGVVEVGNRGLVECPLCGVDISDLSEEQRRRHTNECLDKEDNRARDAVVVSREEEEPRVSKQSGDVPGIMDWLSDLGLAKYEDVFVREEIDWESLQWLTEEDIGITVLGPRKKIVHAISRLRKGSGQETEVHSTSHVSNGLGRSTDEVESPRDDSD